MQKTKNKKYTDEFIKEVMNFKNKNSYSITAKKFQIPIGIIVTWVHKQRDVKPRLKQGRHKEKNIEEQLEILKKFIDFLEQENNKK